MRSLRTATALLLGALALVAASARADAAAGGSALYALAPGAEVRAEPSATAEVLGSLQPGEQVRLHASQGPWRMALSKALRIATNNTVLQQLGVASLEAPSKA